MTLYNLAMPRPTALWRTLWLAATFLIPLASGTFAQTSPPPKIASIRVLGLQRFTEDQVTSAAGLQTGQPFNAKSIEAAVEKLGNTGVFQEISYTYHASGPDMEVQFKVKEQTKFHPCLFENFVWLDAAELDKRLKKDIAFYTGVAPETGGMLVEISRTLEKVSSEKGVSIQVSNAVQGVLGEANVNYLFKASGVAVKIHEIIFTGQLTVSPKDLQREAAPLLGRDYSAVDCAFFAKAAFVPFYRERGYLQVQVAPPIVRIVSSIPPPEFSVDVTYAVSEGALFSWMPPQWQGNSSLAAQDLDAATLMKPAEVANGAKIDQAWRLVGRAYGQKGYIDAKVASEPVFDVSARRVQFKVTLVEGPQYRMGAFSVTGLPADIVSRLKSNWRLQPGDVFDASYPQEFSRGQMSASVLRGIVTPNSKIKITMLPDRERHVVDVNFKLE